MKKDTDYWGRRETDGVPFGRRATDTFPREVLERALQSMMRSGINILGPISKENLVMAMQAANEE